VTNIWGEWACESCMDEGGASWVMLGARRGFSETLCEKPLAPYIIMSCDLCFAASPLLTCSFHEYLKFHIFSNCDP